MSRLTRLSAKAVAFLDASRCAPQYPRQDLERDLAALELRLSESQIETVADLWNVAYFSRASYQDLRYRVAFFNAFPDEGILDYLARRAFVWRGSIFVPDCDTDETHEPEGLVMNPGGALGLVSSVHGFISMYQSAHSVVERDAFLEFSGLECRGTITLKASASSVDLRMNLADLALYAEGTDGLNTIWYDEGIVLVYQPWANYYLSGPLKCQLGGVVRVFGHDDSVIVDAASRLKTATYCTSRIRR